MGPAFPFANVQEQPSFPQMASAGHRLSTSSAEPTSGLGRLRQIGRVVDSGNLQQAFTGRVLGLVNQRAVPVSLSVPPDDRQAANRQPGALGTNLKIASVAPASPA